MTADRRGQLLVSLGGDDGDPVSLLRRICAFCLTALSVSGAAVTVNGSVEATGHHGLVCSTGALAATLDELRLTVGEGPSAEAFATGVPVLMSDLTADGTRWPGFTAGARTAGVAAVFSFPLHVGVVRLGVLELHRTAVGALDRDELTSALLLAEIATQAVLDDLSGRDPMDVGWLSDIHPAVHQASGIVSVQLGVNVRVALLRIRGYAFANQIPLNEVAREIVARRLRLKTGG